MKAAGVKKNPTMYSLCKHNTAPRAHFSLNILIIAFIFTQLFRRENLRLIIKLWFRFIHAN